MARYKPVNYNQTKLLPINYEEQLVPGSFEHTIHHLIESELDLSAFDQRYNNDETGSTAYHPKVLLKVVLYAYSLGITSSRKIAKLCEQHIIFMALSADTRPHFTTIASFVAQLPKEIESIFLEVLLVCEEMDLIGRDMFSVDGCKSSSNASKEWSGTREDLKKKKEKIEKRINRLLKTHSQKDEKETKKGFPETTEKQLNKLKDKAKKIKSWLQENREKRGRQGTAIKSNITDNESAKMQTSHGVIQGYNGVAVVDSKHHVNATAYGSGSEKGILKPELEKTKDNFIKMRKESNILQTVAVSVDSGFHTKADLQYLEEEEIDGYVADRDFRKRDDNFEDRDRFKVRKHKREGKKFTPYDFIFNPDNLSCICPEGCSLKFITSNAVTKGKRGTQFRAYQEDCQACKQRGKCLRNKDQQTARQVVFFDKSVTGKEDYIERMKRKIDSEEGKRQYSRRLGIVEPVFGNLSFNIGLKRFSLRGKKKVNAQWNLFALVHNIGKIQKYGLSFA